MIERTFVMIKPDGVKRGLIGEILQRFERVGLKIVGAELVWVDRDFSKKHYEEHVDKPFYKGIEDYLVSGPVFAFVLEGVNAIAQVRKMVGKTEPASAEPGTIRGDYAHINYKYADSEPGRTITNLIHASASAEDAEREIHLWFSDSELYEYETFHEKAVRGGF